MEVTGEPLVVIPDPTLTPPVRKGTRPPEGTGGGPRRGEGRGGREPRPPRAGRAGGGGGRARGAGRACGTRRTGKPGQALRPLRTGKPGRALRPLRTGRTLRALRAGWTRGTGGPLRSDHSLRPGNVPHHQGLAVLAGRILGDELDLAVAVVDACIDLISRTRRAVQADRRQEKCRTQDREAFHDSLSRA